MRSLLLVFLRQYKNLAETFVLEKVKYFPSALLDDSNTFMHAFSLKYFITKEAI